MVGTAVVAAFRWRWRAALALGVAAAVIAAVALGTPHIRHSLLRESGSGLNKASSGRAKLVTQGIRIARAPPGPGRRHRRVQARVRRPRRPEGEGAEEGGLAQHGGDGRRRDRHPRAAAFLGWLSSSALFVTLRRAGAAFKGRACLAIAAAVAAIGVHSLFYNALFEDPMFWGLLGADRALRAAAAAPPAGPRPRRRRSRPSRRRR